MYRERIGTSADERRNSRRDKVVARRFIVTLGVDLGDRRLETVGAVEGTTGTAMLGGGGDGILAALPMPLGSLTELLRPPGVAWGDQAGCMFCAVARFFRPGYHNYLVQQWLPALDGVVEKLERGAKVADVGCGHGWSTVMMAKAFPKSTFIGYDFHPSSIEEAHAHAKMHGVSANTRFEVGLAKDYPGKDFDLVTCFDCLHDMGDPAGASAHIRQSLKHDGSWMIVEPMAGDSLEQNL